MKNYCKEAALAGIETGQIALPLIAKPKSGFASLGVRVLRTVEEVALVAPQEVIQAVAYPAASDAHYAAYVAALARGENLEVAELSVQLLFSPTGELLGRMALYTQMRRGIPVVLFPYDDARLWETVELLIPALQKRGVRGPVNLDGRMTDEGFKVFEINPRFTGNSGIRALMGFNEVEACIKSYLRPQDRVAFNIDTTKVGLRQVMDRVVAMEDIYKG